MRAAALAALLLASCGSTTSAPSPTPPANTCAALEVKSGDACVKVGVTACAEGFVADDGGCRAVMPSGTCGDGLVALPGESECRPLGECADANGDLFVSASAPPGGNGSRTRPFRTIAAALAVASDGATIAIGAGTYEEALTLARPVTLAGRCAAEVTIRGNASFSVRGSSDVTLRDLALTGSDVGISTHGAVNVLVERVWVHDTASFGVYHSSSGTPATMVIRDSLIERATATGVNLASADLVLERSVVRGTRAKSSDRMTGYGVVAKHYRPTAGVIAQTANLIVRRCVIEQNDTINLLGSAANVTVEASLIRDGRPRPLDGDLGACVQAQDDSELANVGAINITQSVLTGCRETGLIVVGTHADVVDTTIRHVLARARDNGGGMGLSAQIETNSSRPAFVNVRSSIIDDAAYAGVLSVGSVVTIDSSAVRATRAEASTSLFGDGIALSAWAITDTVFDAPLTMTRSLVSESARAGIAVFGTRATLSDVRLSCNPVDLNVERAYSGVVEGDGYAQRDFAIEDNGGNLCGCDVSEACKAQTTALRPVER